MPEGVKEGVVTDTTKAGDGTVVTTDTTKVEDKSGTVVGATAANTEAAAALVKLNETSTVAAKALDEATKAGKAEAELKPLKEAAEAAAKAVKDAQAKSQDGLTDKGKDGAPEKYEDFKLPDGATLDPELVTEFGKMAKELNLPQAKAQALVDLQAKAIEKLGVAQTEAWGKIVTDWLTAAKADKEIGGQTWDENLGNAKAFLDAFGTPELRKALDATGTGNHPEFLRLFARAGKLVKEDKLRFGPAKGAEKPSAASLLFPTANPG